VIEDGAIVGMGSIVLNRARVGQRTMLAAGSVVTEDGEILSEVLARGLPPRPKRSSTAAPGSGLRSAREYRSPQLRYMGGRNRLSRVAPGKRAPSPPNRAQGSSLRSLST
jgi:carbonic anhydrase/acetyltransferase-like protein (isoleucine patch superfamily)